MANCYDIISTGYTQNCLNGNGGIYENEFYWASYDALSSTTANASNIITAATMSGTAKFWRMKQLKNASAVQEQPNSDAEAGTLSYTQTVKFRLARRTTEARNLVATGAPQKSCFIVKEKATGSYWLIGDDIGLYIDPSSNGTSGQKINEFSGWDMVFVGDSTIPAREIQSSVVTSITAG